MPIVRYVRLEHALRMAQAINNAATYKERHEAKLRMEGYKQRCDELGHAWPCAELDLYFMDTYPDRPLCCGELLDWHSEEE